MSTRTFRASSIPEALARVQTELGPDALVLSAQKVLAGPAWQVWRNPEYEVLAMPSGAAEESPRGAGVIADAPAVEPVANYQTPNGQSSWPEPLSRLFRRMIANGLEFDLARQAASGAAEMLGPRALADPARVREHVAGELAARIPIGGHLPRKGERSILVLVGASGAGKTSAAARLAAYARYLLGRETALITLDTFRVGALAQIQTFADILRLPLEVAYAPNDLSAALAAHADKDVLVIDTPARNPRRTGEMIELAALLAPLPPERRLVLVANGTARLEELEQAAAAFRGLGLASLLFTKVDETGAVGSLISLACRAQLPVSYVTSGPRVPEDIAPAEAGKLVGMLLD